MAFRPGVGSLRPNVTAMSNAITAFKMRTVAKASHWLFKNLNRSKSDGPDPVS